MRFEVYEVLKKPRRVCDGLAHSLLLSKEALRLSAGGTASANRDPKNFAFFSLFKCLIVIRIHGLWISVGFTISWFSMFRSEIDLLWIKSI